jgi:Skp family chaperone for outer membrane proteins
LNMREPARVKEKLLRERVFQRRVKRILLVCLFLSTVGWIAPATVSAQATPAPNYAMVDFVKCASESKIRQTLVVQLDAFAKSLDGVTQRLRDGNAIFLSVAEIREIAALYEKPMPTDVEKKRIDALQTLADQRSGALKRLETTANPTDEQRRELEKLTQSQSEGAQALEGVRQSFQQRYQEQESKVNEQIVTEVRNVVARIAKEKNITLVFNATVVVFAATDITPDVVKALQK